MIEILFKSIKKYMPINKYLASYFFVSVIVIYLFKSYLFIRFNPKMITYVKVIIVCLSSYANNLFIFLKKCVSNQYID